MILVILALTMLYQLLVGVSAKKEKSIGPCETLGAHIGERVAISEFAEV